MHYADALKFTGLANNNRESHMPSCKDIAMELTESLDQKLPLRRRIRLMSHMAICGECQRFKRQILFIREAIQKICDPMVIESHSMSPAFREELKKTVKKYTNNI